MSKDSKLEAAQVLNAEYEWLLTEEVPSTTRQLKSFLQACLQKFNIVSSPAHTIKGNNFLLSLPNSDAVKGLINVAGDSVIKAELKFKFPKHLSSGMGTFIFEQCPWKLYQLQGTCNHLKMALEELKEQESSNPVMNKRRVTQLLDQIMMSLSCAKNSLLVPEKQSPSQMMADNCQKVLNPPLPDEVLVNFYVNCDKLIFDAFLLNILTTTPNQKHVNDSALVGSLFEYNGRWFEIANKYEIVCNVPWLKDMIVWINTSQQLCQQLKDKLKVFDTLAPKSNYSSKSHDNSTIIKV